MEPLTFSIAAIASLIAWRSTPTRALCVYFAVLLLYPQYLTLKLGVLDFNTHRILILVIFAKLFFTTRLLQQMKWTWLDRLVLLTFAARVIALTFNAPLATIVEREGGGFMDMCMVYFAVRAIVTKREDIRQLVGALVIIAIPLAIVGAYQSITGHNPVGFLKAYNAWEPGVQRVTNRYGFFRADVTFGNYGAFGLFFAGLLPLSLILHRGESTLRRTIIVGGILTVGVLSSMSTFPLLSLIVSSLFMVAYGFRQYSTFIIVGILSCILFLEFYSDRHFFEVATRFAMNSGTASYRVGLYNETFGGGMSGHWIQGFGYVGIGPESDNSNFNWRHKDLTNIYIAALARTGLIGTLPFLALNVAYYMRLRRAWQLASSFQDRAMVWCFSATLVGWNMAMMAVSTVSYLGILLYALIALTGSLVQALSVRPYPQQAPTPIRDRWASRRYAQAGGSTHG